ncbi:hypothetical protein B0H13DRAFT_247654 [Mycena leptocephala]|nr:hypothetical protein B0H13DRAFT_247654 [Mycena leptocephala]
MLEYTLAPLFTHRACTPDVHEGPMSGRGTSRGAGGRCVRGFETFSAARAWAREGEVGRDVEDTQVQVSTAARGRGPAISLRFLPRLLGPVSRHFLYPDSHLRLRIDLPLPLRIRASLPPSAVLDLASPALRSYSLGPVLPFTSHLSVTAPFPRRGCRLVLTLPPASLGCSVFALRGLQSGGRFGEPISFSGHHILEACLLHIQGVLSLCLFLHLVPVMDEFNPYFFASA